MERRSCSSRAWREGVGGRKKGGGLPRPAPGRKKGGGLPRPAPGRKKGGGLPRPTPALTALAMILCGAALTGCTPPAATLDLIAVARSGLADAKVAQEQSHEALLRQYASQQAALDAAFDADVRLAEAGRLTDAQGKPLAMDARWVIAARKGYVAARDAVASQSAAAQTAHAVRLDNIAAADEALQMAYDLVVQQQALDIRVKQYLMNLQRRASDGK